jgi:hypothetical protein
VPSDEFELVPLGAGTGVAASRVPGVEVSGGGSASVFEPVPGALPPAVVEALPALLDPERPEAVEPGSGDTFVPGSVAPPLVWAKVAAENASPPINAVVNMRRYTMAILLLERLTALHRGKRTG